MPQEERLSKKEPRGVITSEMKVGTWSRRGVAIIPPREKEEIPDHLTPGGGRSSHLP